MNSEVRPTGVSASGSRIPTGPSKHTIYLCYSGAQINFVRYLDEKLRSAGYSASIFLDEADCLPIGMDLPHRLFEKARQCELAIVVLSEEFFTRSKWPMLQLDIFLREKKRIYPLYYDLSSSDVKNGARQAKWFRQWEEWLGYGSREFSLEYWKENLKSLYSICGLERTTFGNNDVALTDKIVEDVLNMVSPELLWDDSHVKGKESLFKETDQPFARCPPSTTFGACVIGLYGKPGIGKTTLCNSYCNHKHAEYKGKVLTVEVIEHGPKQIREERILKSMRRVLRTFTGARDSLLTHIYDIGEAIHFLKRRIPACGVFLAIDNVCHDWESKEEAKSYLTLGFNSASKVLVTSRNHQTLLDLGIEESCCFAMPTLELKEIEYQMPSLFIMEPHLPDPVADNNSVVSRADFPQEPFRHFYENQCRVLKEQLSIAEEVLNKKASPNDVSSADLFWPQSALTELRRVVKLGKTVIEDCQDDPCHKAYLRLAERTDWFVETLKEIVWCMSIVSYYNAITRSLQWNPSIAMDDFPHDSVPVPCSIARVGEAEQYQLKRAALADQKELQASLHIWIQNHSCSAKECGRPFCEHEADNPLMCLAAQILARMSNGEGDIIADIEADHTSVLWKTTQEALEDVRQIGKGSYGTVSETTWLGDTYAKKEFEMIPNDFEKEANALAKLNHPHIVKVSAYSVGSPHVLFLMEKMPGDLQAYMNSRMRCLRINPPFSIAASIDLMLQISEAMSYINSQGMVHRDLKAANILVKEVDDPELCKEGFVVAKLADFGLAKCKREMTSHLTRENLGTSKWRAPEMFRGAKRVGAKYFPWQADVYSFGIVCSEILTGKYPFHHVTNFRLSELYMLITDSNNPLRPELPESCPESLASLIRRCWLTDPRGRPTFSEISTSLRDLKGLLMLARTQRQHTH